MKYIVIELIKVKEVATDITEKKTVSREQNGNVQQAVINTNSNIVLLTMSDE